MGARDEVKSILKEKRSNKKDKSDIEESGVATKGKEDEEKTKKESEASTSDSTIKESEGEVRKESPTERNLQARLEEDNETYKEFNDDNSREFNKQNKLIDGVSDKLDYFEQKLFHSQGGDKTKLDNDESEESGGIKAKLASLKDAAKEKLKQMKDGLVNPLAKVLGFGLGTAASVGMYKIDDYLGQAAEEQNKEIEVEKVEAQKLEGQVQKEATSLTPQEMEMLQAKDVTETPPSGNTPYYLKENPNKSINPLSKEKKYKTSDYVENLISSKKSLDEKMSILAELKKRNDVNPDDIKRLEEHINSIKTGDTNINVKGGDNSLKVTKEGDTTNKVEVKNQIEQQKQIEEQNRVIEAQHKKADKQIADASTMNTNSEKIKQEGEKEAERQAKLTNDTTPKPISKPQQQGKMNNLVPKNSPTQGSDGGGGGSSSSGSAPSGGGGGGDASPPSDASLPASPSQQNVVGDSQAQTAEKTAQDAQPSPTAIPASPTPPSPTSAPATVNPGGGASVPMNNTNKQLAKATVGNAPKGDTVTNEKVVNNTTVEKIPESSWDKYNKSELSKSQDDFVRGN